MSRITRPQTGADNGADKRFGHLVRLDPDTSANCQLQPDKHTRKHPDTLSAHLSADRPDKNGTLLESRCPVSVRPFPQEQDLSQSPSHEPERAARRTGAAIIADHPIQDPDIRRAMIAALRDALVADVLAEMEADAAPMGESRGGLDHNGPGPVVVVPSGRRVQG